MRSNHGARFADNNFGTAADTPIAADSMPVESEDPNTVAATEGYCMECPFQRTVRTVRDASPVLLPMFHSHLLVDD
jgi:hypothetical protein